MKLEGVSILGYSRAKIAGGPVRALNPATGAEIPPDYFWATLDDVAHAAQIASNAFAEYRRWQPRRRADLLCRIAQLIESNAPALIERALQETALAQPRLQGEIGRTCGQLRLFASLINEGWWGD